MIQCLKSYLAMEEWFHEKNEKEEVRNSRPAVAEVIDSIKNNFPRDGNGWKLPKVHGLTKMQYYMELYGSAINFYGGPGECNHKTFVKETGANTQQRIGNFTSQVALRYYENNLFKMAKKIKEKKQLPDTRQLDLNQKREKVHTRAYIASKLKE